MRRTEFDGSFWVCFLINILLNLEGAIPGIVLLVLHFLLDISIWWGIGAFVLWLLYLFAWMLIFRWISNSSSTIDTPKENKNPYSHGSYKSIKNEDTND